VVRESRAAGMIEPQFGAQPLFGDRAAVGVASGELAVSAILYFCRSWR